MRCSRRSAPLRSTLQDTPGYLASNALPICSESFRSIEVYQTTLPSFFAASISADVTALAGGAADSTRVENEAPAASTPEPINTSRRENLELFIGVSSLNLILLLRPREILRRYASSARHFSGGRTSQTALPCAMRSEEHTSELLSLRHLVCR